MGFSGAPLLHNFVMLITMPNLEASGIQNTNLLNTIFLFIFTILALAFINDSPRNLILQNEAQKAFEILYKIGDKDLFTYERKMKIIKEIKIHNDFNLY
jgi:hypothetical protein